MKELILALTILSKYTNTKFPFQCEHNSLHACHDVKPEAVSQEDKDMLAQLGFDWDEDSESWQSYRYGNC